MKAALSLMLAAALALGAAAGCHETQKRSSELTVTTEETRQATATEPVVGGAPPPETSAVEVPSGGTVEVRTETRVIDTQTVP